MLYKIYPYRLENYVEGTGMNVTGSSNTIFSTVSVNLSVFKNFQIFAGITPHFNFNNNREDLTYDPTIYPAISQIAPELGNTVKTWVWYHDLGVRYNLNKVFFEARAQYQLSKSMNDPIEAFGQQYPFESNSRFIFLNVGYRFGKLSLKRTEE